ncbi:unnamed protein product [Spirodela intermedia]|uniref:Cysteine-rich transmembrane domain-containing protein n=1 Tax=Spirodela intermedia TaxID=51605 RepID=A0A7I8I8V5_SPIIN|nr:unnamed protein product [Spirodela intermedia]CAA6654097.1 unnamed protein product [Spirodela intermedia]
MPIGAELVPPPGYPTAVAAQKAKKKPCCPRRSKQKGDRGFLEGCMAALCCCCLCEICFD